MKQSDVAVIIIVVFIGGIASFFLSGFLFSGGQDTKTALVVDPIEAEFPAPDARYFNVDALDPTRPVALDIQADNTDNE